MRKLELKDVAGYLPYGLICVVNKWCKPQRLVSLTTNGVCFFRKIGVADMCLDDIKPILRPMSDIRKEIIVEGYNNDNPFTPSIILAKSFPDTDGDYSYCDEDYIIPADCYLSYEDIASSIDLLNQWHFDYRGLIQKGLAIDINTIKE